MRWFSCLWCIPTTWWRLPHHFNSHHWKVWSRYLVIRVDKWISLWCICTSRLSDGVIVPLQFCCFSFSSRRFMFPSESGEGSGSLVTEKASVRFRGVILKAPQPSVSVDPNIIHGVMHVWTCGLVWDQCCRCCWSSHVEPDAGREWALFLPMRPRATHPAPLAAWSEDVTSQNHKVTFSTVKPTRMISSN